MEGKTAMNPLWARLTHFSPQSEFKILMKHCARFGVFSGRRRWTWLRTSGGTWRQENCCKRLFFETIVYPGCSAQLAASRLVFSAKRINLLAVQRHWSTAFAILR